MAGFKQTIKNMNPVLFVTFDGENYDPGSGNLDVPAIQDESSYRSTGTLLLGNEPTYYPPGYRAGINSCVDLEHTANKSMTFGYYGYQPASIDKWQKAFIVFPNQTQYSMPKDLGSFAITFMYNRSADESDYRKREYWGGVNDNSETLSRMIVRKAGMVQFRYIDYWAGVDEFELTGPDGKVIKFTSNDLNFTQYIFRKNTFFTIAYNVEEPQVGVFKCRLSLWVNGIEVKSVEWQTLDTPPVVNTTAEWELMGTVNPSNPTRAFNDRHTTPTTLDQLAVFNRRMSPTDIMDLFRKSRYYDDVLRTSRPRHYYKFDDEQAVPAVMVDRAGNWESGTRKDGMYLGGIGKIGNRISGPATTFGSVGTAFNTGGMAAVAGSQPYNYPSWRLDSDNWTIEFWFRAQGNERGVLFSNQSDRFPHPGQLVQLNWRNNAAIPGTIEVQMSDEVGYTLQSKQFDSSNRAYLFNDFKWHHLCVVRNGQKNSLYIDGVLHDSKDMDRRSIKDDTGGQFYFMGMMPERLYVNGEMCNFAMYDRSLQVQEIQSRVRYSQLYRVKGRVTLFGADYPGTIRAYNHGTGELIKAVVASGVDGNYSIDLPNNDLIDLMALNPQDPTVRYRSYGPITPAQVDDPPL